jgi:hypothetical protein
MDRTTRRRARTLIAAALIAATLTVGGAMTATATTDHGAIQADGRGVVEDTDDPTSFDRY